MTQIEDTTEGNIPLGKISLIWAASGIILLAAFGLYEHTTGIPIEEIQRSLTVYLLQGSIFLISAFWALSCIGTSFKCFFKKAASDIYPSIKTAGKYFSAYAVTAAAVILLISLAGVLMIKAGGITIDSLRASTPNPARLAEKAYLFSLLDSPLKLLLYIFTISIVIPIEEEIFFRRLLYSGLRRKIGFVYALLISSAIFSAVHPGGGFGSALINGLFLGWVYERTNNIYANILLHGLINLSVTAAMIFIG
jgi:membrane protease YdiL (CAAX protease family)